MIFNQDPLFIDAASQDLRLEACSPAIDSGSMAALAMDTFDLDGDGNTMEALPLDLDDSTRVVGAEVDMGAYEYRGESDIEVVWYQDADGDSYTSGMDSISCTQPTDYIAFDDLSGITCDTTFEGFENTQELKSDPQKSAFTNLGPMTSYQGVTNADAITPNTGSYFEAGSGSSSNNFIFYSETIDIPDNSTAVLSFYWTMMYDATSDPGTHDLGVEVNETTGAQLKEENKITSKSVNTTLYNGCLLYTSPSPRDRQKSRMPSSA